METLKEVQNYVDEQIKVLEEKKQLLILLEHIYETLTLQPLLVDYDLDMNPYMINNISGRIALGKNNLTRCIIEAYKNGDVNVYFEKSNFTEPKRIPWVNRITSTERLVQEVLEGLK